MARSYRDGVELRVELIDREAHPLVRPGTVIVLGTGHPAVDGPVPMMLSPGHEYRIRELIDHGDGSESLWIMEIRSTGSGKSE